jgi:hypothetical protein
MAGTRHAVSLRLSESSSGALGRAGAWRTDQRPKFMDWAMTANPFVAARRLPTTA